MQLKAFICSKHTHVNLFSIVITVHSDQCYLVFCFSFLGLFQLIFCFVSMVACPSLSSLAYVMHLAVLL